MELRAFHGKEDIKKFYLNRVREHIDLDEIFKGVYFEDGEPGKRRMCGIGCTIHDSNHKNYELELGIPYILARLEDNIFERLPNDLAKSWPLRFLEAINVGSDLSKIWPKFAIYLLTDSSQCNLKHPQCKIVADCFQRMLNGETIDWGEIRRDAAAGAASAYDYASDAAYAAAGAAYGAASASAAYTDASNVFGAASAAYAADAYAAASNVFETAKQNAIIRQSEKLLELLKEEKGNI